MTNQVEKSTVIIVDDDDLARRSLVRLSQSLGYTTEEFSSGQAFLDRAPAADGNACAVVDFAMPDLDGLEVQSRLAELDISIPIVFVSGCADATNATRAFRMGAITVLQKPVTRDGFRSAVEEAFAMGTNVEKITEARRHQHQIEALTPHERRIVTLAADGHPNKRIASILGCSIKTIEKHRRRAYDSLGVNSTAEMTRAVTMGSLYDLFRASINKRQMVGVSEEEPCDATIGQFSDRK